MPTDSSPDMSPPSQGLSKRLFNCIADFGQSVFDARLSPEARRLLAQSDDELKAQGLTRELVVRTAFGNRLYR